MSDGGVSDTLGSLLLLGVTATVAVAVGGAFLNAAETVGEAPTRLDLALRAKAGDATVTLIHTGGPTVDAGGLRVTVTRGNSLLLAAPLASPGTSFGLGDRITVALPVTLGAGDPVAASVVAAERGEILGAVAVEMPSVAVASPPAGAFTVVARFPPSANWTATREGGNLLVEAVVHHSEGRKAIRTVLVNLSPVEGAPSLELFDDGLGGDAIAGDGVYAASFRLRTPLSPRNVSIDVRAIDGSGAVATAKARIHVKGEPLQFYDAKSFHRVGHEIKKTTTHSSGDSVSVAVKVNLTASPITVDGKQWTLNRILLYYSVFRWGGNDPIVLTSSCSAEGGKLRLFQGSGQVSHYDSKHDHLQYHFELEWKNVANANDLRYGLIEASERFSNFTLRSMDASKVVLDDGWPTNFTNCA